MYAAGAAAGGAAAPTRPKTRAGVPAFCEMILPLRSQQFTPLVVESLRTVSQTQPVHVGTSRQRWQQVSMSAMLVSWCCKVQCGGSQSVAG